MHDFLKQTIALLSHTPAALDAFLRGLPEAWTHRNEGPNTWTPFDIVGHLIHAEKTDWIPRIRIVLEFGESRAFTPFDREAQKSNRALLPQLLDEFASLRAENLKHLRDLNLTAADLDRRGRHPDFGAVTLGQLLSTWAAHDLNHLHQLARVMAHQYREAVGPWEKYLGVLHCSGHSAPAGKSE